MAQATPSAMPDFLIGPSLERSPEEIEALRHKVEGGALRAKRVDNTNGDVRYWAVDVGQSPVLRRLKDFGEECFSRRLGRPPLFSFVMVNEVDARTCPSGSGGGWHRDALLRQFKAFVYLTNVETLSQGPF